MVITKETYVSDILKEHGDIAEIMEAFGLKRVGGFSFRKLITRLITVKTAAFVHGVELSSFLRMLNKAVEKK